MGKNWGKKGKTRSSQPAVSLSPEGFGWGLGAVPEGGLLVPSQCSGGWQSGV